jgi:hypothetical protein
MTFRVSQYYVRTQKQEGYRFAEVDAESIEEAHKIVAAGGLDWEYRRHDPDCINYLVDREILDVQPTRDKAGRWHVHFSWDSQS